jgi:hypothetical protein
MSGHDAVPRLMVAASAVLLMAHPGILPAQSTSDAARTMFGVSFGILPGSTLWEVTNQPITPISPPPREGHPYPPDIVDIHRELEPRRPVISVHGTRYLSAHLGLTAEFAHFAIKTRDGCAVVTPGGDPALAAICDSVAATPQGSPSSDVIQAGVVLRASPSSVIQPFALALAGIALTPTSTAALKSDYASETSVTIYSDPQSHNVSPSWTVAAGLATMALPGLQAHVEVRNSWITESIVSGPSLGQSLPTPVKSTLKGFVSVLIGFDLVLARQRGKRY